MRSAVHVASVLVVGALVLLPAGAARGQEFRAEVGVGAGWVGNILSTRDATSDALIAPHAHLGVDFARYWSVDYEGSAEVYPTETGLVSHAHALTLAANPAWGPDGRNEVYVGLTADTLVNAGTYDTMDFAGAKLAAALTLEPAAWVAWGVAADVRYRRFWNDTLSDALDVMPRAWARFTLPSRTTLTPRVAYGFRYSPGLKGSAVRQATGRGKADRYDHQLEVGLNASQGLWPTGGLQAGYAYRHLFATSSLLPVKLTQSQFAFLSTDFLAGGHRAFLRFKQVIPAGFAATVGLEFQALVYAGWPALDAAGTATGRDRSDRRLSPSASLGWKRETGPVELETTATYTFFRQWSTSYEHESMGHAVMVDFTVRY